ncbi:MAG: hypothetical protein KBH93_07340 [Anaerolineae bacterium]|nr:hypothetical protein [Anaerolineae bacterium]
MRFYQRLDHVCRDQSDGTLLITGAQGPECAPALWIGREGVYVNVSATCGPLEIALRPRQRDLQVSLAQLWPTERLSAMRMVGTGQATLELGLSNEGELLFRMTIVADATGHLAMNLVLTSEVRQALFAWLDVEDDT